MKKSILALFLLSAPAAAQEMSISDAQLLINALREQRIIAEDRAAQLAAQVAKLTRELEAVKKEPAKQ